MFKPNGIFRKIGMEPDRFRFLVKRGVFAPDVPSTGQGSANLFSLNAARFIAVYHALESIGFGLVAAERLAKIICDGVNVGKIRIGEGFSILDPEDDKKAMLEIDGCRILSVANLQIGTLAE